MFIILIFFIFFQVNSNFKNLFIKENNFKNLPINFTIHSIFALMTNKILNTSINLILKDEDKNKYFYASKFISNIFSSVYQFKLKNRILKKKFNLSDLFLIPINLLNPILGTFSFGDFSLDELSRIKCTKKNIFIIILLFMHFIII